MVVPPVDIKTVYSASDGEILNRTPNWLFTRFTDNSSMLNSLTYRSILKLLFDKHKSIYRIVEYKGTGCITTANICSLSFVNRTTILLSLLQHVDNEVKMRVIFKFFLRYANNINFFHPTPDNNTLCVLHQLLMEKKHPDILTLLLQRKEIQQPDIVFYLHQCITDTVHIEYVLDMFVPMTTTTSSPSDNYILYECLLRNYIKYNTIYSRRTFTRLLQRSRVCFTKLYRLLLTAGNFKVEQISWVQWSTLTGYNDVIFRKTIMDLFEHEFVIYVNAHELLTIYNGICRDYNITIKIPDHYIQQLIASGQYYPEHLLLFECTHSLEKFRHLLSDSCNVVQYIRKRFIMRYRRFALFWLHKTYRPGSKIFQTLGEKYSTIMAVDDAAADMTTMMPTPQPPPNIKQLENTIFL